MPKFVYQPEGAEPRSWDFQPNKLMSPEAIAIEKLTGMTFIEWQSAFQRSSMTAIHALLWVLLKRTDPTLRPEEVQFSASEIDLEVSDEEAADALERLEALPADQLDDDDRAVMEQLRDRLGGSAPKDGAPSTSGDAAST